MPRLIVSYGRVKVIRLAVVAVVLCTVLLTLLHHHRQPRQPSIYDYTEGRTSPWRDWKNKQNATRTAEVNFLDHLIKKYSLTNEVTWSARVVQAKYGAGHGRPSMTEVAGSFMKKDFVNARIQDESLRLSVDRSALKLPVAGSVKANDVDASVLLFGISTTYSRLVYLDGSLMRDWERWLTDGTGNSNGASLVLTLQKSTEQEVNWVEEKLRSMGIDATVLLSEGTGESAYVDLLHKLGSHSTTLAQNEGGKPKSYIAVVDDDIFFPSMGKLVQKLSKFDPEKEHYVGAPSERSDWVIEGAKTWTYGGGAVFLTAPMLEKLTQLPCLSKADKRDDGSTEPESRHTGEQWDLLVYECLTKHTSVDLHVLPSFYNPEEEQLYSDHDRRILVNEGYASGAQPLTLHHYRNLHRFEAGKGHLVTSVCGEACFLQRFRFRDDWILVNGYTLSHYPDGVDTISLKKEPKKQKQLDDDVDGEDQKVVSGRRIVVDGGADDRGSAADDVKVVAWAGRKRTWRLLDAKVGEGGEIWQAYVKRRGGGNTFGEVDDRPKGDAVHAEEESTDKDSVVVLIWQP